MKRLLPPVCALLLIAAAQPAPQADLVIRGARAIDPETGLDGVRTVAIREGRIVGISEASLQGSRTIDGTGMVLAPGFIDLHSHGQTPENYRLKALDGVTTALELEIGVRDVAKFYATREGTALINYGAAASHPWARVAVRGGASSGGILPSAGPATNDVLPGADIRRLRDEMARQLDAGALGIGMGLAYTPGATRFEVIEMFRLAASRGAPVFVHVRSSGPAEPGSSIESIEEVIGASAVTGASLHIVHINSSGLRDALECLRLVEGARARGLDVTTESYPYGAGMTEIGSAFFNDGWKIRTGITERELQRVDTGERLSQETFARLRRDAPSQLVLLFLNPEEIVDAVMTHPLTIVASDGEIQNGKGHPRAAGTYARVLSRYVRGNRISLTEAIRKMSLMPAMRLERISAAARRKGRVQVGADADLVLFDPATVVDRATYDRPAEPSDGFRYVLVGGTLVVDDGRVVEGARPGRAVRATP